MPRKKLDYKDKLHQVPIHIKGEVLETLGRSIIQETAEKSVNKEYLKAKKQPLQDHRSKSLCQILRTEEK
jgi:hypothetical protein